MSFGTSIQSFTGANTPQDTRLAECAVNWSTRKIFIGAGPGYGDSLSRSDIASGAQEAFVSPISNYDDSPNHVSVDMPPLAVDSSNTLYFPTAAGVVSAYGATLSKSTVWGQYAGGLPPGLPQSAANGQTSGIMATVLSGGHQFLLVGGAGGLFSVENSLFILDTVLFAGQTISPWAGNMARVCSGKIGSGLGFLVSGNNSPPQTNPLTVYKISPVPGGSWSYSDWPTVNSNIGVSVLGTIAPAAVDSGWTYIGADGICVDQTDGNLLILVLNDSGATYLIKVSSTTGSVLWKAALPVNTVAGQQMAQSRILTQNFCIATNAGPKTITTVNTATGSTSSYTTGLAGIGFQGPQCYDDSSGAIICNVSFASTTGSPVRLNSTPGSFTGWAALYVASPPPAPATPRRYLGVSGPIRTVDCPPGTECSS